MSKANWFFTRNGALNQHTKQLITASGDVTYTAKVGSSLDGFETDRVIRVTSTDSYNMDVTVPDGVAYGQRLLVIFEVEANTETVDVTTTTGDDATQMTAAGGYWEGEWHGSTLGWATINGSAT